MTFFDFSKLIEKMLVNKDITGLRFFIGKPPLVEVNKIVVPSKVKGVGVVTRHQMEIISRSLINGDSFMAEELVETREVFGYFKIPNYRTPFRLKLLKNGTYSVVMRLFPSLDGKVCTNP